MAKKTRKFKVRYMTERRNKRFFPRYYWQPHAPLNKFGWSAVRLGYPLEVAEAEAEKLNESLDRWRENRLAHEGGCGTVAYVIRRYLESHEFDQKRPSTKRVYRQHLNTIEAKYGKRPAASIRTSDLQNWHEKMARRTPCQANAVIIMFMIVLGYAFRLDAVWYNAAKLVRRATLTPRQQMWTDEQIEAVIRASDRLGVASIGTAVLLAVSLGQRQGDILRLSWTNYRDGVFKLRQSKTGVPIEVPALSELRERLATVKRVAATTIVVCEKTGRPWDTDHFRHEFLRVRAEAGRDCVGLGDVWFMDLRRTAVVRMAEADCTEAQIAAVTGHKINTTRAILETYLPRTDKMAAIAIAKVERKRGGYDPAGAVAVAVGEDVSPVTMSGGVTDFTTEKIRSVLLDLLQRA